MALGPLIITGIKRDSGDDMLQKAWNPIQTQAATIMTKHTLYAP